jgi:copper chaperone CopZ
MEQTMAHYIHHVPGRLRLRTPRLKRDAQRAAAAEALVQTIEGVTEVRANSVTGSLTVAYQRDVVSAGAILEALAQRGYYEPELVQHADRQLPAMAARAGDVLGKALFGMVLEKAVERSAFALIGAIL